MRSLAPQAERRLILKSFIVGCTGRIYDRMMVPCEASAAARTGNSRALVVVKNAAIADKMQELGIKIRNVGSRCGNLDIDAYDAGRQAGDAASFGRPVEGKGAVLRLT
jgi:hypothetical protein